MLNRAFRSAPHGEDSFIGSLPGLLNLGRVHELLEDFQHILAIFYQKTTAGFGQGLRSLSHVLRIGAKHTGTWDKDGSMTLWPPTGTSVPPTNAARERA